MIDRAQIEITASASQRGVFFQCPVGGFASLSPGLCPKCQEALLLVTVPAPASGHSGIDMRDVSAQSNGSNEVGAVH